MNWSKRVGRLMKTRRQHYDMVQGCHRQGLENTLLGVVAQREFDKLDYRLIRLIEPRLKGETVGAISQSDIDRAREHPIENLFDGKTKSIRCIFHDDKNPSASIKNNRFKCFACGKSADVIECYMKLNGKTFTEAVKELR